MSEMDIETPDAEVTLIHAQEAPFDLVMRRNFNEATREIFVDDGIDPDFGGWFLKVHRYLCAGVAAEKPITVWLNTGGGDVQSMFMFCDTVKNSRAPITVIGHGNVCSAGVLMLAAGHKRLVTRHVVMMVHQYASDGESEGLRYAEAKERRKWEDWTHVRMIELMAEYSGRDVKYWKSVFDKKPEHWLLGGQEIVDEGLADEVLPY